MRIRSKQNISGLELVKQIFDDAETKYSEKELRYFAQVIGRYENGRHVPNFKPKKNSKNLGVLYLNWLKSNGYNPFGLE